jgi:3-oxoacyl-[acyl-carrier protein] reductase
MHRTSFAPKDRIADMDLGITGYGALVLGASGGLGRAIATALAAEGARVAVAGRDNAELSKTLAEIHKIGGSGVPLRCDLRDHDQLQRVAREAENAVGTVSILINNTGGPPPGLASGREPELWLEQFNAMVLSVIQLTDHFLPKMRAQSWGRIITSTSSGILAPIENLAISNALRLTLAGWSKSLAREEAPFGITANVVVPGRIATRRTKALDVAKAHRLNQSISDVEAESLGRIPMGRFGRPEEYADLVAFLASKRASYITGTVLRVDGGMIASL